MTRYKELSYSYQRDVSNNGDYYVEIYNDDSGEYIDYIVVHKDIDFKANDNNNIECEDVELFIENYLSKNYDELFAVNKSLKADKIKDEMNKINDYWFNVERTDLDLKYYIHTEDIINALKEYEIPSWNDDEKIIPYCNGNFEQIDCGNTYNNLMKVQNDFSWILYKADDIYYMVLSFHRGGDIRGNYSDSMLLKFDYEEEFWNVLDDDDSVGEWFDLEIDGEIFHLKPVFDECLRVEYEIKDGDYTEIYHIWGSNDDEVIEQLKINAVKSIEDTARYYKNVSENETLFNQYNVKLNELMKKFKVEKCYNCGNYMVINDDMIKDNELFGKYVVCNSCKDEIIIEQ